MYKHAKYYKPRKIRCGTDPLLQQFINLSRVELEVLLHKLLCKEGLTITEARKLVERCHSKHLRHLRKHGILQGNVRKLFKIIKVKNLRGG